MVIEGALLAHTIHKKGEKMMKKFCYTIFAILIFSITGCTTSIHISTSESDSSDFTSESYSAERSSSYSGGMDDWKCYHRMTKIEEYKTFYTEFLKPLLK